MLGTQPIKKITKTCAIIFIAVGFISCQTYYIPIDSFKSQFKGIDSNNRRLVKTRGPAGDIAQYYANPIDYIKCIDKNNNPHELKNSPSIEIRFTEYNNKKTVFYFDEVYLQDTLIVGERSRFISLKKTIPINNVKLIEVQDGKKNFKYVDTKK